MIGFSLITLAARGPVFNNKKWLGWGKKNEWAILKPKPKKASEDQEMGIAKPNAGEADPSLEAVKSEIPPVQETAQPTRDTAGVAVTEKAS